MINGMAIIMVQEYSDDYMIDVSLPHYRDGNWTVDMVNFYNLKVTTHVVPHQLLYLYKNVNGAFVMTLKHPEHNG